MTKKNEFFLLLIIFFFSLYCAITIGNHWDATYHITKGEKIYKYIFSLGKFDYDAHHGQQFFPGFVFFLKYFISTFFPKKFYLEIENVLNLFISFLGLFSFYRLNKILFNKEIAKISFIFLISYPIFFGHALMNPKDTVILTSNLFITYYIIKYLHQKNTEKHNVIIYKIAFFLALGSSVRLIFVGTLFPFILLLFIESFYLKKIFLNNFSKFKILLDLIKIFVLSFLLLVLFWPEVLLKNIFYEPFVIFFKTIYSPPVNYLPGLLNGKFYLSTNTPYNQILINFLLKTPEYILFIYIISFAILIKLNETQKKIIQKFKFKIIGVFFYLFFSYLLITFSGYSIYDNMRTYLYLIPYFLIFPSISFWFVIKDFKKRFNYISSLLITILFFVHLHKFFLLTPYQYTYVNYLNGNFKNNISKFENDYLGTSIKELIKNANFLNENGTKITLCGNEKENLKIYLKKNNFYKTRIVRADEDPQYVVMTNRIFWGINDINKMTNCYDQNIFQGKDIKSVERIGLKLSVIRKLNN